MGNNQCEENSMTQDDLSYCQLIAGENHRRGEINRIRVDREPESYSISKVTLETNFEEKKKTIDSNNKNYTDIGNKRATMGRPQNSTFMGIRSIRLQQFNIVGYGVKKIHILHSNVSRRDFATDKDISMGLDKSLEEYKKDVYVIPDHNKVTCYSENKPKLLYAKIFTLNNIMEGFKLVKNKKSAGVDKEFKSDISTERLTKLHKDLRTHRYKPKPSRRVAIPKTGGGKRYLGIASTIDKVVQMVIVQQLTPILESKFSEYSYGFRPNLGCHDALSKIRHG